MQPRPTMNALDKKPAYIPAVSLVADGTKNSTMYPEYGKTLIKMKKVVKTLLHNPSVLMKCEWSVWESCDNTEDRRRLGSGFASWLLLPPVMVGWIAVASGRKPQIRCQK